MNRWQCLAIVGLMLWPPKPAHGASAGLIEIDGAIGPATAEYVARAIRETADKDHECLIVRLDTPGGLLESTKGIVQSIYASPKPVIVYVGPAGATATSAGCFITLAADVAAMAEAGTVAVLLPGAYYYLQEKQKPPIELFRRYGVPMAVATDHNPGTSPTLNLPLMLNMACVQFGLTPDEALLGVTLHAAKALGWHNAGRLSIGNPAVFTFLPCHPYQICYQIGL